jgi:hypothetical protein
MGFVKMNLFHLILIAYSLFKGVKAYKNNEKYITNSTVIIIAIIVILLNEYIFKD